jgi:hypothetical protein
MYISSKVQFSLVNSLLGIDNIFPYDFLSEMELEVKFFVHLTDIK